MGASIERQPMAREYVDFHRIEPQHTYIHGRLCNWRLYVHVRPDQGWRSSPMWRNVKSSAWQWHTPEHRPTCDMIDGQLLEECIRKLPHHHRFIIRWNYVYGGDPAGIARKMGMTTARMYTVLCEARTKVEYMLTYSEMCAKNAPKLATA
jgi:hypothetical protein